MIVTKIKNASCLTRHLSNPSFPSLVQADIQTPFFLAFFLLLGLLLLLRLRRRQLEGLGRAVLAGTDGLPSGRTALEVAEGLGELEGLCDDTLLLLVVSDLGVAGEGEVLAERVTLEAVVGHDAAQVGVAGEEDAKKIVGFALVPVGAVKEGRDGRNGRRLVGVGLDADAGVVADRKQVVDDLEALLAGGIVGGRDGADLGELGGGVV